MADSPLTAAAALRDHWPEYLIEGAALGIFMVVAGAVAVLLAAPDLPLLPGIPAAPQQRVVAGIALGLTAIAIIQSPWGRRSGAHLNPAVTLTFWRLGKVKAWDAVFYTLAQVAGAAIGVQLLVLAFGHGFTDPPVSYIQTLPGPAGTAVAFLAEVGIAAGMMATVLLLSASPRWARWTGLAAGALVATYIAIEAPISGMSLNPARSLATNVPAMQWRSLWVYLLASPLGMLLAAGAIEAWRGPRRACAKLLHTPDQRCIHCGYEPAGTRADAITAESKGDLN